MVLYIAFLTAFSLLQAEKKRKKNAAGRRGGGMMAGELVQAVRMTAAERRGGRRAAVVLVVRVCGGCGAATIKVCNCTAFEAWIGGGEGYFCTVPTLHRRRRWIGSRRR